MKTKFRFAIASDLHIALPHTVYDHPHRFHLVEYSISAFEVMLQAIALAEIDFLLLPGDLTQHGELANHQWLGERLRKLSFPVYVIPGNHDLVQPSHLTEFAHLYQQFGYDSSGALYYAQEILPQVRLIGLNSNSFDDCGNQLGVVDNQQLAWLERTLADTSYAVNLVMIHHNILDHVPDQGNNPLGRRYILTNAQELCSILQRYDVHFVFTGHLHVQDIAWCDRWQIYDITTGSLVSYPHPYRVIDFGMADGVQELRISSHRVCSIPEQADLLHFSREWMGDRSAPFVQKLLVHPPLSLSSAEAEAYLRDLRYFWAEIAAGDARFSFPNFPEPMRSFLEGFSDRAPLDNDVVLRCGAESQGMSSINTTFSRWAV